MVPLARLLRFKALKFQELFETMAVSVMVVVPSVMVTVIDAPFGTLALVPEITTLLSSTASNIPLLFPFVSSGSVIIITGIFTFRVSGWVVVVVLPTSSVPEAITPTVPVITVVACTDHKPPACTVVV